MTNKQKPTKISILFDKKFDIQEQIKQFGEDDALKNELKGIEEEIANEIAEDNRNKVVDAFKALTDTDGTVNINGMWGQKRKTLPKNSKLLPASSCQKEC